MNGSTGLCDICNKPSSNLNSCRLCGAKVCDEHYDSTKGICTRCKRGAQVPGNKDKSFKTLE